MNYPETLNFLYESLPMFQRSGAAAYKKDLGNIREICEALGNPQNKFKSIHVAGTNGKGSSAHMLSSVLQAAGYKTGLYTSPHLKSFTERIRINGAEISEQYVVESVGKLIPLINRLKPSFFEITVAMAFMFFAEEKVDIAIIEVGLGGRLDSTNIIMPEVCLITNIGLDHEQLLGNTLELIAGEKAGIIKPDIPVVIGTNQPDIETVFINKSEAERAPIYFAANEFIVEQANIERINVIQNNQVYLEGVLLDLKGNYQKNNIPGVLKVLQILAANGFDISEENIVFGLQNVISQTGLKGRWQILQQSPLIVCDTGHNQAGLAAIVDQIRLTPHNELFIVFGVVNDKTLDRVLEQMPTKAIYIFCQSAIPRALDAEKLAEEASAYKLFGEVIPDVNEALKRAKMLATPEDMIFVGGSTFVVAEINEL